MNKSRRKFSSSFKAKVTLEAIKEQKSINELCQEYNLQAAQIKSWKASFLSNATSVFENKSSLEEKTESFEKEKKDLYAKIGELQVSVDFLKKALS